MRASELQGRRYHLIFWAEIQPFPQRTLNRDRFLAGISEVVCHRKEGQRLFFLPFHSLLSNASCTSLRISGLYYKHTAISFKRNRQCSVFPLIIQSSNIYQNTSIFVTQFVQSFCHCCYYFSSSCSIRKKLFISQSQQSFLKSRYSTYLLCQNLPSTANFSSHGKLLMKKH